MYKRFVVKSSDGKIDIVRHSTEEEAHESVKFWTEHDFPNCYVREYPEDTTFIDLLDESIGFERSKDISIPWTEEYREGYVDGLKQAKELYNEVEDN